MNKMILWFLCLILILSCVTSQKLPEIASLSDEFDNSGSIVNWKRLCIAEDYPDKVEQMDIDQTEADCLYIKPMECLWWEGYHGTLLYKEIQGDFMVTTKVKVQGAESDFPQYPYRTWQIAGVMARISQNMSTAIDKRKEDWIFNTYGAGISRKYLIDVGVNIQNSYVCYPYNGDAGWTELCMVRIDKNFIMLSKDEGGEWVVRNIFEKLDFPRNLQVGLITNSSAYNYPFTNNLKKEYSYSEYNTKKINLEIKPDLRAYFDYIKFKRPGMNKKEFEQIKNNQDKLVSRLGL